MNEKALQNEVVTFLQCNGAYVLSVKSGKLKAIYGGKIRFIHLAPKGTPDLSIIWHGRPLTIELKKDERTAKNWHRVVDQYKRFGFVAKSNYEIIEQHLCHRRILRAGGDVIVCGSMNELKIDLTQLGYISSPSHYGRTDPLEESVEEDASQESSAREDGERTTRRNPRPQAEFVQAPESIGDVFEGGLQKTYEEVVG